MKFAGTDRLERQPSRHGYGRRTRRGRTIAELADKVGALTIANAAGCNGAREPRGHFERPVKIRDDDVDVASKVELGSWL